MANDLTTGRPRVVVNIVDSSLLNANTSATIACVMGATTKGEPYKPTLIKNLQQFTEEFGDLDLTLGFPLQCKRALEAGAQLYVARVAHWASTTWEGTKAAATITQSSNSITFTAKYVGKGYNSIVCTVRAAKSGDTTKVDIIETQGRISTVIKDITRTTVPAELAIINAKLRFTVVNSLPTTMPIGMATTANGA